MASNPYAYDDDFFGELEDTSTGPVGDSYEYAGHTFSETKPCTKCKAFHYLPGLKNIDDQFSDYVSAILREFVRKFELENRVYASAIFMGMMYLVVGRMDFEFSYGLHKNSTVVRSIAEKNEDEYLKIPLPELIKIHRAEMLLVAEAYRKNILGVFENLTKSRLAKKVYVKNESDYINASVEFFSGIGNDFVEIITSQYKELCEKYNYPINQSYLDADVLKFVPRNEIDRLYTLENVRNIVSEIVNKIFERQGIK